MKANELRIGNLAEFSTPKLTLNIHELNHVVTANDISNLETGKIQFDPIPLTEEWLVKFGFKIYQDTNPSARICKTFRFNQLGLEKAKKCWYVVWYDANDDYGVTMTVIVKYVHQLQNLYFALTGTELILEK